MNDAAAPRLPPEVLRVLLVDDEELARLRLRALVEDCPEPRARVVGEAGNAAQARVWLQQQGRSARGDSGPDQTTASGCDLVLLDIQMPGPDGTQFAEELRSLARPPAVVFVTAHAGHAVKAFDLDAVDYLTKPVRRERLQQALQRAAARLGAAPTGPGPIAPAPKQEAVLVVSERGRVVRVPVDDVLYLKAELKYVTLRTAGHSFILDDALSDLEHRLGDRFLRVHRNALVARSAVRALERRALGEGEPESEVDGSAAGDGWAVCVAPVDEWLAVSRRQVSAVREALAASGL